MLLSAPGLRDRSLIIYQSPDLSVRQATRLGAHSQALRPSWQRACIWPVQTAAVVSTGINGAAEGVHLQTSQSTTQPAASAAAVTAALRHRHPATIAAAAFQRHGSRRVYRTATHSSYSGTPGQNTPATGSKRAPSQEQQHSDKQQQQPVVAPAQQQNSAEQTSTLYKLRQRVQHTDLSGTAAQGPKKRPKARLATGQLQQRQQELLQLQQAGPPSYAAFKIAAAGSTDLLLSFVQSQVALILEEAVSSKSSSNGVHLTIKQRRVMLWHALVAIAWHCCNHQLLPAEAQRLQDIMLQQLLPMLAPHIARTQLSVLARVVFALGTCASNVWDEGTDADHSSLDGSSVAEYQVLQATAAAAATTPTSKQPSSSGERATAARQGPSPQQRRQQHQEQHNQLVQQHAGFAAVAIPRLQQHQFQLGSESWVHLLIKCLPPGQLTAGALLATWAGCALHEVRPPDDWLAEASTAAYYALQQNKLDFNDVAALLQACAQLGYSPPSWLMQALVHTAQQQLPLFNPGDLAGVLSSLQALSFRPSNTFLRVWCESGSRLLCGMNISDLAAALEALAWAGYNPQPWWARRFVAASLPLLPMATPDELLLLLDGALNLRLTPPMKWVHECYCHLRARKEQLSPSQIADAAHVLANLQPLPDRLVAQHRAWLALCLRQQQPEDVAALDRSELLYTLYAAGKLRVRRTRRWLVAALRQLHEQLPGAEPAELIATFVVFSYFMRQRQAQGIVQLGWLRDVLAAVCECVGQISSEGLLQLIVSCADREIGLDLKQQQQQQQQQQQDSMVPDDQITGPAAAVEGGMYDATTSRETTAAANEQQQEVTQAIQEHLHVLTSAFLGHVARMDLVELSRVCKALEAGVGSTKAPWYLQVLQQCKTSLAGFV